MRCRWMWRKRRCPSSYFGLGEGKHPGPGMVSQHRLMDSPNGPSRTRSTFSAGSFCPPSHSKTTHTLSNISLIYTYSYVELVQVFEADLTHTGNPWHLDVVMTFLYSILSEEQEHAVVFTVLAVFARFNKTYGNDGWLWNQTVENMKSQGPKILQAQLWTEERYCIWFTFQNSIPIQEQLTVEPGAFHFSLQRVQSMSLKRQFCAQKVGGSGRVQSVSCQVKGLVRRYCCQNHKLSFTVSDPQLFTARYLSEESSHDETEIKC